MANETCCTSGGRLILLVNGRRWSVRAAAEIEWTSTTREVQTNQDGSIAVVVKPQAPKAKIKLSNKCGLNLNDLLNCNLDVTLDMIDAKKKFYFTNAFMTGRPSLNSETGEISGLEVTASFCKMVDY